MRLTKIIALSILLFSAPSFAITANQKAINTLQTQITNVQTEMHQALAAQQTQTQKAISDLQVQVQGQITQLQTQMQQMQTQLTNEIKQVQAESTARAAGTPAPVVTATPGITEPAPAK
ncbi:MAG TPA: hypothetical protein VJK30_07490 [Coxiellaceae bacterium]|nr:MAG: hypothetical protein A3E81_07340 [Gammaproteobacteria bacterium RIFCSPHIGHO2_12_FULL_36_30]HLB57151.1 hypothetical protein [Coxiellaceae bacterium]